MNIELMNKKQTNTYKERLNSNVHLNLTKPLIGLLVLLYSTSAIPIFKTYIKKDWSHTVTWENVGYSNAHLANS